jgi:Tfp pilus assembly protein PilV
MNPIKNNSGFSLIEALIAALIIVAGLMAYLMASGNVVGQNAQSKKKTQAVTLAQDKMESIKNTVLTVSLAGADGLASPTETGGVWSANVGGEVVDAQGATGTADAIYTRTWTITPNALAVFDTVSVTVTWDGSKTITLDTLISE